MKETSIKRLSDASLIEEHQNIQESQYDKWAIERELFERAFNPNPAYLVGNTSAVGDVNDIMTANTVTSGSTYAVSSTYDFADNLSGQGGAYSTYNWGATPLYGYVSTLNYVTCYTIHAKIDNITYQVGLQEFATHEQARSKILHILNDADRVELVTFRGSFNEYDYPKVKDVDRFYIRQQTKQIETNPYNWYDFTYCTTASDTTTTTVENNVK